MSNQPLKPGQGVRVPAALIVTRIGNNVRFDITMRGDAESWAWIALGLEDVTSIRLQLEKIERAILSEGGVILTKAEGESIRKPLTRWQRFVRGWRMGRYD